MRRALLLTIAVIAVLAVAFMLATITGNSRFMPLLVLSTVTAWSTLSLLSVMDRTSSMSLIVVAAVLTGTVLLTLIIPLITLASLVAVFYGTVFVLIAGAVVAVRNRRSLPSTSPLVAVGLTVVLAGCASVLVGAWRADPSPILVPGDEETWTLAHLYASDQDDRRSGHWILNTDRDQARLDHVLSLVSANEVTDPMDEYHAAYILQHGTCSDHFELAYQLASSAAASGVDDATALADAAEDRWLLATGRPQENGTQFVPIPMERTCS